MGNLSKCCHAEAVKKEGSFSPFDCTKCGLPCSVYKKHHIHDWTPKRTHCQVCSRVCVDKETELLIRKDERRYLINELLELSTGHDPFEPYGEGFCDGVGASIEVLKNDYNLHN